MGMGGEVYRRCKTKLKQFSRGIGTVLCPKLGEDQDKNKKRSSLRFGPILCPKLGKDSLRLGSIFVTEFSFSPESK